MNKNTQTETPNQRARRINQQSPFRGNEIGRGLPFGNTQTVSKTKSGWVRRLGNYEGEPRCYRIIRFHFNGSPRTVRNNVTLTEAQAHCSREDTSSHSTGNGAWFDGYDYMKGCRPKQ